MKRIKIVLLLCSSLMALGGCGSNGGSESSTDPSTSANADNEQIKEIYALYQEAGGTLSYEEWLETIKGEPGVAGKDGSSVLTGHGEPSSDLGKEGDSYIDLDTWDFFIKESTGWSKKGNIKGQDLTDDNPQGLSFHLLDDGTYGVGQGYADYLSHIDVPNSYKGINVSSVVWFSNQNLVSISIAEGILSFKSGAFAYCSSLTSIDVPNTVTSIEHRAIHDCSALTSIVIPNSVATVGSQAFKNCASLTIYCEAESKPAGWDDNWNPDSLPVVWGYSPE